MDEQIMEGETAKQEFKNIKVYSDLHKRICEMIKGDWKNFRIQSDVIRFLFQQYDEKIKDENFSFRNKDNSIEETKDTKLVFDSLLKALNSVLEQNKIIAKGMMGINESVSSLKNKNGN